MRDGYDNEDVFSAAHIGDAVGKSLETAASNAGFKFLPRVREFDDSAYYGCDIQPKLRSEPGQFTLVVPDGFVELNFRKLDELNDHWF